MRSRASLSSSPSLSSVRARDSICAASLAVSGGVARSLAMRSSGTARRTGFPVSSCASKEACARRARGRDEQRHQQRARLRVLHGAARVHAPARAQQRRIDEERIGCGCGRERGLERAQRGEIARGLGRETRDDGLLACAAVACASALRAPVRRRSGAVAAREGGAIAPPGCGRAPARAGAPAAKRSARARARAPRGAPARRDPRATARIDGA